MPTLHDIRARAYPVDMPRCKDCGDPATERADQKTISPVWGVMSLPSIPVCPPCKLRREAKG